MSMTIERETALDDGELERLAADRAEIERALSDRADELDSLGSVSYAVCTDFNATRESGDVAGVAFHWTLPDDNTRRDHFDVEDDYDDLQSYLGRYGADSPTDMLGAKHGCVRADGGWHFTDKVNPKNRWFYALTTRQGSLTRVFWPPLIAGATIVLFLLALGVLGAIDWFGAILAILGVGWLSLAASAEFSASYDSGGGRHV